VLAPTSAHGTNPATAAFVGYTVVEIAQTDDGRVDLADLEAKLGDHVAAIMVTNPNTCGLFERDVLEIAGLTHAAGAYFYCDGANFNAIVGRVRPGDLGVDAMHINLHKTFSTPHGGGGPGAGPVVLSEALAPFAPTPWMCATGRRLSGDRTGRRGRGGLRPHERLPRPDGHVCPRLRLHAQPRRRRPAQVAEDAVLNANYIKARLSDLMSPAFPDGPACTRPCSTTAWLEGTGVTTLDFAKAMIDEGFHPMTMYFPLVVHGAMLIEPTETESKQELDRFVEALRRLATARQGRRDGALSRARRSRRRLRRLDETLAARKPRLRWKPVAAEATGGRIAALRYPLCDGRAPLRRPYPFSYQPRVGSELRVVIQGASSRNVPVCRP
jgi:glycine dehydrogenase subunit 2